MASFISQIHNDLRQALVMHRGATQRPEDVPRGEHKEYPRMPKTALPKPEPLAMRLDEALAQRESFNKANLTKPLTAQELGTLLGNALGMRTDIQRKYPSGGALYPVETYLIGNVLEGYEPGAFHYHPKAHALEHLWDVPDFKMSNFVTAPNTPLTQIIVIFTAVWAKSSPKYGDWAYHLAMLEAGHMSQNVLLTSTAMGLLARPIGGFNDEAIATLLDIDDREQDLHSILLAPKQTDKSPRENSQVYE
jgi:SagB-type dehydrogenase family enzyme